MKRLVGLLTVVAAAAFAAGCSGDGDGVIGDGKPTAASANQVCDEIRKINMDAGKSVADAGAELAAADPRGDQGAAEVALRKLKAELVSWSDKLGAAGNRSDDARVRKDVNEAAADIKDLSNSDRPAIQTLNEIRLKTERLCG